MASFESHMQILERTEVQSKDGKTVGSGEAAGAPTEPAAGELPVPGWESRFLSNVWLPNSLNGVPWRYLSVQ